MFSNNFVNSAVLVEDTGNIFLKIELYNNFIIFKQLRECPLTIFGIFLVLKFLFPFLPLELELDHKIY